MGANQLDASGSLKRKMRPDGTIEKYKARLMAKGYTQKEGEDFFDAFPPVARTTTIRVLLVLAASYGLLVHQMDVKTYLFMLRNTTGAGRKLVPCSRGE